VTLLALLPTYEPVPETTSALDPGQSSSRRSAANHRTARLLAADADPVQRCPVSLEANKDLIRTYVETIFNQKQVAGDENSRPRFHHSVS
jgi:hypothetical protein